MRKQSILVSSTIILVVLGLFGSTPVANVNGGIISHWRFDEGGGTMAYDSAGTNDGTIYGAQWTTGQIGSALDFDGVDDYVQLPAGAADLGLEYATQSFTIEMWLKTIQTEERYLFDNYRYTLGDISFRIDAGKIEWHIGKYRIGNYILFRSEASVNDGLWHYVACTWDGAGEASIFVDGNSSGSSTNPNLVGSLESGYPFLIGTRIESSGLPERFFRGTIDEVAIYQRALTSEEIWEIYVSYLTEPRAIDIKPGSCPNPLNTKSRGVLPVAVLGSEDFDVDTIDIASIRLAGVAPIRSSFEDVAALVSDVNECACSTEGPDGFTDLTLKFETQKIVEAIGEVDHGDELVLQLTGVLSDGTPIEGSDCIVISGRHKPLNRADFNGDGTVDMADFAAFAENQLQSSIVEY